MGEYSGGSVGIARSAPQAASLLVVFGGDRVHPSQEGRRRVDGATDLHRLLGDARYDRMLLPRRLPRLPDVPDLSRYRCVLNLITDPDLNPRALENLRRFLRGYPGKLVNRPEAVLRSSRDQVAACLAGTPGLHVPAVVRVAGGKPHLAAKALERSRVQFPLIVRRAGTHTGNIIGLVESSAALEAAVAPPGDYVATEFADYRSADGLYRKYRVFFFGERIVFRHMIVLDEWSVHGRSRLGLMADRPDLLAEEARLCAAPEGPFPDSWQAVFPEIRRRMQLDFFGIDFGVGRDGRMVLFEANATMNFFPPVNDPRFDYLKLPLPAGRKALADLVQA